MNLHQKFKNSKNHDDEYEDLFENKLSEVDMFISKFRENIMEAPDEIKEIGIRQNQLPSLINQVQELIPVKINSGKLIQNIITDGNWDSVKAFAKVVLGMTGGSMEIISDAILHAERSAFLDEVKAARGSNDNTGVMYKAHNTNFTILILGYATKKDKFAIEEVEKFIRSCFDRRGGRLWVYIHGDPFVLNQPDSQSLIKLLSNLGSFEFPMVTNLVVQTKAPNALARILSKNKMVSHKSPSVHIDNQEIKSVIEKPVNHAQKGGICCRCQKPYSKGDNIEFDNVARKSGSKAWIYHEKCLNKEGISK